MIKVSLILGCLGLLLSCGETPQLAVPVFKVQNQSFAVSIPAVGELEAALAEKINTPGRSPMTIE